ncbi:hypothetical protein N9W79_01565 [bacterium]|nr:hypothetical protein [bacterium]
MSDVRGPTHFTEELPYLVQPNMDMEVIDVPSSDSLYLPSDELNEFIARLQKAVSNERRVTSIVVLKVSGARADDLSGFVSFQPSHLRFNVLLHLSEMRDLFKKIYDQRSRFVMVTDGDLLGSWFELGLCCGRIVVLDHLARVGFSQLSYGFLPALGSLEINSYFSKGLGKAFWEKGFLWNALDVPEKISLDVVPIGTSSIDLKNILTFNTYKEKFTRSLRNSRNLPFKGDWDGTKKLRKKHAEILWEKYWAGFLNEESFSYSDLTDVLASWFEASEHSVLSYSASSLYGPVFKEKLRISHLDKLWVDVTHYLPPLKLLVVWAQTGVNIVFFSDSSERLSVSVRRIYEKMSLSIKKNEFQALWFDKISWTVIGPDGDLAANKKVLRFISDGSVECLEGGNEHRLIRLATNDFKAKIGTVEQPLPNKKIDNLDPTGESLWAYGLVFRKVIKTYSLDKLGIPASQWLRACFLEELVKEASHMRAGLRDPLKWLSTDGWGFVSDESWWASHVVSRFSKWPTENGKKIFEDVGPSETMRDIASWNQVLKQVKSGDFSLEGSEVAPQRTVPNLFSEHFLIFSALLGLKLYEEKILEDLVDVDVLVRYALELPDRFGSPIGYIQRLGKDHILEYATNYFSAWGLGSAISFFFKASQEK